RSLQRVLTSGAKWALGEGFATADDLAHMEEGGSFAGADPTAVSERALERGRAQLGTLGSGNHFCEVGYVERVFDETAASAFGLVEGRLTVMVHSGSRGFGYQVCDDSLRVMLKASADHGIALPDRQLCAAPLRSAPARQYLAAMACAVNYAFANRQLMTHAAREAFERVFGSSWERLGMSLVYDVCHNIAKWETHEVEGRATKVCVHRKGATRAFPAGHPDVPEAYRAVGQPVLVPGDMGRCSYVLAGQETAMAETFGSCCHGAGRVLSRAAAKKAARGRGVVEELAGRGILVQSASRETVDEEMPEAYKDVSQVVDVVERAGLARKVARLVPLAVVKG
ncbi:MAG: RtcB family protein, partial [Deltaproteobacteria bacterium]|nr:RtcB family protein [Deltaproteobacteria bacterium]